MTTRQWDRKHKCITASRRKNVNKDLYVLDNGRNYGHRAPSSTPENAQNLSVSCVFISLVKCIAAILFLLKWSASVDLFTFLQIVLLLKKSAFGRLFYISAILLLLKRSASVDLFTFLQLYYY